MNGQRTFGLIAVAMVAAMLVSTAAVAASEPLTPQAIRAMGERYQAMAEHYGTSSSLTPQAIRAMGERYQAMAEYHRRGELEQARQAAGAFDWLDAGIGALAAIGAVALLGLGALRIRSHGERSASPAAS
jgi:hypothetical protein